MKIFDGDNNVAIMILFSIFCSFLGTILVHMHTMREWPSTLFSSTHLNISRKLKIMSINFSFWAKYMRAIEASINAAVKCHLLRISTFLLGGIDKKSINDQWTKEYTNYSCLAQGTSESYKPNASARRILGEKSIQEKMLCSCDPCTHNF